MPVFLLQAIKKPLSNSLNNEFIKKTFLPSSKFNALVFPCNDQPSLGYSFYRIIKRFMLRKGAQISNPLGNNILDKTHLARSTFNLLKTISDNTTLEELSNNNTKLLYNGLIKYVNNHSYGNVQMKTNLITGVLNNKLSLADLSQAYENAYPLSKVSIVNKGVAPARIFAEIGITTTHVNIYDQFINNAIITGDTIAINSKNNPNPDLFLTLKNPSYGNSERYYDIKSGTGMVKKPLQGTIGQLTFENGIQISTPNEEIDLDYFNRKRKLELQSRYENILDDSTFIFTEKQEFKQVYQEYVYLFQNAESFVDKHIQLEKCLYYIQTLPSFPKAISFINIVVIPKNPNLSQEEIIFMKILTPKIQSNCFNNTRTLHKFIKESLEIYNYEIDPESIKRLNRMKDSLLEYCFLANNLPL